MSGGDDGARATVWSYDMCMRYFTAFACMWIQWIGCAGHSRHGTSASRAAAQVRRPRFNPFPSLLQCAVVGCAEAPEIVPEGPGYRC